MFTNRNIKKIIHDWLDPMLKEDHFISTINTFTKKKFDYIYFEVYVKISYPWEIDYFGYTNGQVIVDIKKNKVIHHSLHGFNRVTKKEFPLTEENIIAIVDQRIADSLYGEGL